MILITRPKCVYVCLQGTFPRYLEYNKVAGYFVFEIKTNNLAELDKKQKVHVNKCVFIP